MLRRIVFGFLISNFLLFTCKPMDVQLKTNLGQLKDSMGQLNAKLDLLKNKLVMLKEKLEVKEIDPTTMGMFDVEGALDPIIPTVFSFLSPKDLARMKQTSKFFRDKIEKEFETFVINDHTKFVKKSATDFDDKSIVLSSPNDMGEAKYIEFTGMNGKGPLGKYSKLIVDIDSNIIQSKTKEFYEDEVFCEPHRIEIGNRNNKTIVDKKLKEITVTRDKYLWEMELHRLNALKRVEVSGKDYKFDLSLAIDSCPNIKEILLSRFVKIGFIKDKTQPVIGQVHLTIKNTGNIAFAIPWCPENNCASIYTLTIEDCPDMKNLDLLLVPKLKHLNLKNTGLTDASIINKPAGLTINW